MEKIVIGGCHLRVRIHFRAAIVQLKNQTESSQIHFLTRVGSELDTDRIGFFDDQDSAVEWMAQIQKISRRTDGVSAHTHSASK